MKKLTTVGACVLFFVTASTASAQQQGDWVLGQWQGGSDWYPGVVESRDGNQVTLRYDDGTRETRPVNQVRTFDWRAGTRVVCRFTDNNWYGATITTMDEGGLSVSVRYDDGVRQQTETGRCRSE